MMRKNWMAALALGIACTVSMAAEVEKPAAKARDKRPLLAINPGLPKELHPEARKDILRDLQRTLSELFYPTRLNAATENLVMRIDSVDERQEIKDYVFGVAKDVKAEVGRINAPYFSSGEIRRSGNRLGTTIQVVMASRTGQSKPDTLGNFAALVGPLQKRLGYQAYEVIGQAMAEGVVGEPVSIETRMRWREDHQVSLKVSLEAFNQAGSTRIKGEFRIVGQPDKGSASGSPFETGIGTTYKPKAGKPLVVGASPLDSDKALLFVMTHEGEGIQ